MRMYVTFILICCCLNQIFSAPGNGNITDNPNTTIFQENSQNLPIEINSSLQQNQSLTSASNNSYEELTDDQHQGLGSGSESKGHDHDLGSGMEPDHDQHQVSGTGPIFIGRDLDQGSGMGSPFTEGQDEGLGLGSGFDPLEDNKGHSSDVDHENKN